MASPTKSKIYFFQEITVSLKKRNKLKKFISHLIKQEGYIPDHINYIFCSDERLLEINKKYLKHDYYTDIITFELSEKNQPIQAEIYISAERVKDNAKHLGISFTSELLRVMIHGALHLCGYTDKNPRSKKEMTKAEDLYIKKYLVAVSRDTVSN